VVIDLEQAGIVNLAGPPDEIMATMETMALELAVSPLADTIEILCVNFGHQLAGFERVTVVDNIVDAADLIATHDTDAAELAAAAGMSALEGRVREIGGNASAPVVVFAPNSNHAAAIAAAANHTPAAGVTAVVTGDTAAIWQVRLSRGHIEIPHVNMTLLRRNLTADELAVACSLDGSAQIPLVAEVPDTVADPAAEKAAAEKAAAAKAAAETQKAAAAKAAAEAQKAAAVKAAADKVAAERAAAEAQKAAAAKAAAAHLTGMYAEAIVAINDMYAEAIVAINEATHA
jgi:hypothetical protein